MKLRREEDSHSVRSYASEGEDLLTERLFYGLLAKLAHELGVYVDIGAYDPIRASNTHRLYQRGWHGLNIEPNPDQIPRFVEFRPRDTTVNIGVAEERGQLLYTQFTDPLLNGFLDDGGWSDMCDWEMDRFSVESAFRLLRLAKLSRNSLGMSN